MAKRVYYITALLVFLLGVPILNYFAYSNEKGDITIIDKAWTDFCNATSWNNTADIPCSANFNFTANNDTFWYPVNYNPTGKSTPYAFEPSVKDWKLERKWGNGWKEIPMTKPCNATWCGKGKYPVLYSVAWRKGKSYETRIIAIKNNPNDSILWSFGTDDPIWFGIRIEPLKSCYDESYDENIVSYKIEQDFYNKTIIVCSDEPVNLSCSEKISTYINNKTVKIENTITKLRKICTIVGIEIDGKKINWNKADFNCKRDFFKMCCDSEIDGNGDGICTSGESYITFDIRNLKFNKNLFHKKLDRLIIE